MENNEKEYTIGEFEKMDLSELFDKSFMVAISTGSRDKPKFICSTLCGPLNFVEMVETVGTIYADKMLHAKVMLTKKEYNKAPEILDENTVDYIEAKYMDILMNALIKGNITEDGYTCKAGFVSTSELEIGNEQDSK